MADIFCLTDIDEYIVQECGIERAGVIALLLIDTDQDPDQSDLESASFIDTALAATPPHYWLISPTRGEYNGGTPTEEEGYGTESTQITGADHEFSLEFEGLKDNRDFVEGVNRRKFKIGMFTNAGLLLYVDVPVTIYTKIVNGRNIKSGAFWQMSGKWQSYDNPHVYTAPDVLD